MSRSHEQKLLLVTRQKSIDEGNVREPSRRERAPTSRRSLGPCEGPTAELLCGHALVEISMLKEAAKEQEKMHTTQMTELRKDNQALQQLIRTQTELLESLQTQMTELRVENQALMPLVRWFEPLVRTHTESLDRLQALLVPKALGLTCAQAKAAGLATCLQARAAGFSCTQAREAGFTCQEAREAGFTCQEARAAGFTCQEARAAGFKPRDCAQAGFTFEEGKAAGYPHGASWAFWWDGGKSPPEIRTPVDPRPSPPSTSRGAGRWLSLPFSCAQIDWDNWDGINLG